MKRLLIPIAAGLTAIYLALAVQAAVCLFGHGDVPAGDHHHHPDKAAHSTLCVWACQANHETSLGASVPVVSLLLVAVGLLLVASSFAFARTIDRLRSRAPPILFATVSA
ncbi:MAG: hypothetical protein HZA21_05335 [Nitrospirae bacterium]|nr:hypothetical protein [Nitrospirota bacterium]